MKLIARREALESPQWFVMTSPDPKRVEQQLLEANLERTERERPLFHYFVPYQFLKRRIASENPEDTDDRDEAYFNPKNRADVRANNELRALLKRYIFIKAPEAELEALLTAPDSLDEFRTLWFYLDKSKRRITVPSRSMEQFINACCDLRLQFEVWPAISGLEKNEEVILNTTEFKGQRARVLEVQQARGEVELTVGFHIFADTAMVKLRHIRLKDVLSEARSASPSTREANRYRFIEDTQRKVFALMEHRLDGNADERAARRDAFTLEQLNNYRYRQFESPALQAKYCALMLFCILLSGDTYARRQFVRTGETLLAGLDSRPEEKSPRDVRAYLLTALHMATGKPDYREEAMHYFHSLEKPTATHRHLMKFIRHGYHFPQ